MINVATVFYFILKSWLAVDENLAIDRKLMTKKVKPISDKHLAQSW